MGVVMGFLFCYLIVHHSVAIVRSMWSTYRTEWERESARQRAEELAVAPEVDRA